MERELFELRMGWKRQAERQRAQIVLLKRAKARSAARRLEGMADLLELCLAQLEHALGVHETVPAPAPAAE